MSKNVMPSRTSMILLGPVQPIVVPSPPLSFSTASLLSTEGSDACGSDAYGVTCSAAGG